MRTAPPGLVFAGLTLVVAGLALGLRMRHDAPPIAPLPTEAAILADVTLVDGSALHTPRPDPLRRIRGAASSISESGLWVTATSVVAHCRSPMLMATPQRGLPARLVANAPGGVSFLSTVMGAPPLPLADKAAEPGAEASHPGFPDEGPGEVASRLIGQIGRVGERRDIYAETGRTEGLGDGMRTIAGAPVLDEAGRMVGLTLSDEPRRGRLFAAPLTAILSAMHRLKLSHSASAEGRPVTLDNYGIVADSLRRSATVAAVVCLDPSLVSVLPENGPRSAP